MKFKFVALPIIKTGKISNDKFFSRDFIPACKELLFQRKKISNKSGTLISAINNSCFLVKLKYL